MVKLFSWESVSSSSIMRNWHLQQQSRPQQVLQNTMAVKEITLTHDFISFCKFCFHTHRINLRKPKKSAAPIFIFEAFDRESKYIASFLLRALLSSKMFEKQYLQNTVIHILFIFQPPDYITKDICMSKDGFPKNWSENISLLFCQQSVPLEAKACYVIGNKRVILEKKG